MKKEEEEENCLTSPSNRPYIGERRHAHEKRRIHFNISTSFLLYVLLLLLYIFVYIFYSAPFWTLPRFRLSDAFLFSRLASVWRLMISTQTDIYIYSIYTIQQTQSKMQVYSHIYLHIWLLLLLLLRFSLLCVCVWPMNIEESSTCIGIFSIGLYFYHAPFYNTASGVILHRFRANPSCSTV